MNRFWKIKRLWLLISALALIGITCKSKKTAQPEPTNVPAVTEFPKPASEPGMDSVKHELDIERAKRLQEKNPK